MNDRDLAFFGDAGEELDRARRKFPREEGVLTDAEWLAVLTEEVGEAARAIQDESDDRLIAELVQVAAMAARWAVAIPLGRRRPPWAEEGKWLHAEGGEVVSSASPPVDWGEGARA